MKELIEKKENKVNDNRVSLAVENMDQDAPANNTYGRSFMNEGAEDESRGLLEDRVERRNVDTDRQSMSKLSRGGSDINISKPANYKLNETVFQRRKNKTLLVKDLSKKDSYNDPVPLSKRSEIVCEPEPKNMMIREVPEKEESKDLEHPGSSKMFEIEKDNENSRKSQLLEEYGDPEGSEDDKMKYI